MLARVAEFQNVMADLYLQQAQADEMLYFLAMDYRQAMLVSEYNVVIRASGGSWALWTRPWHAGEGHSRNFRKNSRRMEVKR